ncbi:MAG: OmpA family protein [Sphingobacteriaceae bacterium]|nr:OmpA family protein [Sphingobacteriaceae bacterium]
MKKLAFILIFLCAKIIAQDEPVILKVGDKAPSFLINLQQNSVQSFNMPYMNRLVLLHFWSSSVGRSKVYNKTLNRIAGRYKNALYRNADGFEVVAIAVQSDKTAWNNSIKEDTLNNFTHGIALRGYKEEVCKLYRITQVPTDILIDHEGTILAINPHVRVLEDILDEKKNFLPVKKNVVGTLALSSNPSDLLRYSKLYLFDAYGDSLGLTTTNQNGGFVFGNIKLNQDFILKVDNQSDIITSDPIALYSQSGEKIMEGKTHKGGFIFYIPSGMANQITEGDHSTLGGKIGTVNVIKDLVFKNNGTGLLPKDETELNAIVLILQKNKSLAVEVKAYTDSKLKDAESYLLTKTQCNTVKNYLINKGVEESRIKQSPKGKSNPRKKCTNCSEDDHKSNRRIEFVVYKN